MLASRWPRERTVIIRPYQDVLIVHTNYYPNEICEVKEYGKVFSRRSGLRKSVFDNLGLRIEGSKVVLVGQVVRPTLKSNAEGAAKCAEVARHPRSPTFLTYSGIFETNLHAHTCNKEPTFLRYSPI